VGGSVPINDEIILNLSKMNKILDYDKSMNVLTCEAGLILEDANNFL
jgi:(R)-2-hydroxyglutarate---pyruvate transhydrogenase